jgi:hypothetical protein
MAVSFGELVVGQRYRVTKGPNEYVGVLIDKHVQTEEDKNEIHTEYRVDPRVPEFLFDYVVIQTGPYEQSPLIVDGPDVTYELLPAAGGRHRKSRRSHRKSRRSHRKSRKSRNTRL